MKLRLSKIPFTGFVARATASRRSVGGGGTEAKKRALEAAPPASKQNAIVAILLRIVDLPLFNTTTLSILYSIIH
jgi:hypothetical protein